MSTKTTYKISKPTTGLDPVLVLSQLPKDVRSALGPVKETGFMLGIDRRDIFCANGFVEYILGSSEATVDFPE